MTCQGAPPFEQAYPPTVAGPPGPDGPAGPAGPTGPAGTNAPLLAAGIVAQQSTIVNAWATVGTACLSPSAAGADIATGTLTFSALMGMLPSATSGGDLRLVSVATGLTVLSLSTTSTAPVWVTTTLAGNLESAFFLQVRVTVPGETLVVYHASLAQAFA
jgi:hypothetical protein